MLWVVGSGKRSGVWVNIVGKKNYKEKKLQNSLNENPHQHTGAIPQNLRYND